MRSVPLPLGHALAAALLAFATACAAPEPWLVEAQITGSGTLTPGPDGDSVRGTATLTLSRAPGIGDVMHVTVTSISTRIGALSPAFTIDDPSPIDLSPGESAVMRFHFEGAPSMGASPNSPWGLICDFSPSMVEPETFHLSAGIFDSVKDAQEHDGHTDIMGTGVLQHAPPIDPPPPPAVVGAAWSERFGGAGENTPVGVAIDASGNMLVSGTSRVDVDFGQGPIIAPMFLAKLGPGGQVIYGRSIGSGVSPPRVAAGGAVEVMASSFSGEIEIGAESLVAPPGRTGVYVARIDEAGDPLWVESFVGPADLHLSAITVDPMGGITLGGTVAGVDPIDLGGGALAGTTKYGAFVVGLDASGNYVHGRRFDHVQSIEGIAADPSGAILLTGLLFDAVDFGGGPLPVTRPGETWVAKLDATGEHVWSQLLPWFREFTPHAITTNAAGDALIVAGGDAAKIDPSGAMVWQQQLGQALRPSSVAMDDAGRVFVAGTLVGVTDIQGIPLFVGSSEVHVLVELDAGGSATRATPFGCAKTAALLHHRPGIPGVALAGSFRSLAVLDQGPLAATGSADVLAAMLMP